MNDIDLTEYIVKRIGEIDRLITTKDITFRARIEEMLHLYWWLIYTVKESERE